MENKSNHNRKPSTQINQTSIDKLIDELEDIFRQNIIDARVDKVREILKYKTGKALLARLSERNLENIITYIINDYPHNELQDNQSKADLFKDLYFQCIKSNQIQVLETIDKRGINYGGFLDDNGNTGLLLGVIYSQIQVVKFFLKQKPYLLESKNEAGYDAVTLAVYNNDNLMFFLLVNNIQQSLNDWSSLCKLAIRNENIEILTYLTKDIGKSKCPYTAEISLLHYAACQTDLNILKLIANVLKKYDHQIKPTNETPLHWAVMRSNYNIIKHLVTLYKTERIKIDQKTTYGVTPFYLANLRQDKHICELLFENGANANESDNEGNSIVHIICALGDLKWLKYIMKKFNVNIYMKNDKGDTPFVTAILNENVDVVEFFLEIFKATPSKSVSNLNWKNKYGQTPLHAAVFVENLQIIEMLLRQKADISIEDINELTPYHYAYIGKKESVIRVIHDILGVDKNMFMK